jgi:hypothetical protein
MSLVHDLQNLTADISAKIAASEPLGRVELEVLRRNLQAATSEAGRLERQGLQIGGALTTLCDGIERGVADLTGLSRHARSSARTLDRAGA